MEAVSPREAKASQAVRTLGEMSFQVRWTPMGRRFARSDVRDAVSPREAKASQAVRTLGKMSLQVRWTPIGTGGVGATTKNEPGV